MRRSGLSGFQFSASIRQECSVVGLDTSGAVVLRRRAKGETVISLAAKLSPCIVRMEACCGAHHLGRVFAAHGHEVRLMSPEYFQPLSGAEKRRSRRRRDCRGGDASDDAVCELKSQEQLDTQTLNRS